MKALNKIWIAAIAAVAMTACNNELSEQALNNGGNVNFTMGIGNTPSSRVSMPETGYTASFVANDEVGIFVAEVPSYTNVKYSTADGTAWTGGPIKVSADAVYTYYAYYPYAADMAANNIPVVVATNQDTEGYIKNDFLYKKYVASQGQTDVKLTFDHALSLVEVTLAGSGAAEGATVDLLNVATDATIDLTAETPVTTGSTTATVTMDALSSLKYRAIVPAQKIAASTPVFKIAVNGRTYQAKYSGEINFEQGKYLAMTITLGEQGGDAEIEITASASIKDWEAGSSNGGQAEIEEVPLISKFEDTDFISANSNTLVPVGSSSTWFYILGASAGESQCEITDITDTETEDKVTPPVWQKQANVKFVSTYVDGKSSGNNWWTAALGYFYNGEIYTKETSMYKLSFKAKAELTLPSDVSSSENIQLYVICRNSTNDACFAIRNNTDTPTATNSTKNLTAKWGEYVFYIHFDKKLEGNPRSLTTNKETGEQETFMTTDLVDYQNIHIRICTNGNAASEDATPKATTLSVTDVKLEPYVNN